jgi:hypothetical protein
VHPVHHRGVVLLGIRLRGHRGQRKHEAQA